MSYFLANSPSFWSGERASIAVAPLVNFGSLAQARAAVATSFSLQGETISTLLLTVLLAIGLFFFLRASGKDRLEARLYSSSRSLEEMGSLLCEHLEGRAYRLQSADAEGIATFVGQAQPSVGLAVFLTGLAGAGLACLALVLQVLEPGWGVWPWTLLLVSPWAGWYYWRRNHRPQQLRLRLQEADPPLGSLLWVEGQREELEVLATTLGLQERDPGRE
ncbi:cofactor assembly of complex C subunit B [Synechococcus sp. H60.1]|uniref:cofactor assembly of complex C subunit B n=2 Tax=unclassified Synechococcus TaxID=2626047 RepID=UPI0039C45761